MRTLLRFFFPGFRGRISVAHVWAAIACRLVLWVFFLAVWSFGYEILLAQGFSMMEAVDIAMNVFYGFLFLQALSGLMLGFCRLHDAGIMGIPALLVLIPPIGWLPLLFLYMMPGNKEANEYGEPNDLFT